MEGVLMNLNDKNTLIDIISKHECQVNHFIYANKVDTYDSFDFQECTQSQMSKLIFDLLESGLCNVFCWQGENKVNITEKSLECYQKNQYFDFNRYDGIALSKLGVEYWEKHYQPNWHYYIDVIYDDKDYKNPVNLELISLNENLLKEICQNLSANKIKVEILDEWEICYWKTINNQPIFKYSYTAKTLKEKILVDEIWSNLSQNYRDRFCPKSRHFY